MNKKFYACRSLAHLSAIVMAVLMLSANLFAQEAVIPVYVTNSQNVAATVSITPNVSGSGTGAANVNVPASSETDIRIQLSGSSSILYGQKKMSAPAMISRNRSGATLSLQPALYSNAVISLHSVNGKRVLNSKASASSGSLISSAIPAGVYLLSVKGVNGNSFSSKLTHRGGKLNINVAFTEDLQPQNKSAEVSSDALWTITATAVSNYTGDNGTVTAIIAPAAGRNERITINFSNSQGSTIDIPKTMKPKTPDVPIIKPGTLPKENFTETVNGQSFEMIYVPGGTFTIGCESGSCPPDASPVSGVTVSNYFIAKNEVTPALWKAVMGGSGTSYGSSYTSMNWYEAQDFACELTRLTGKRYRMMTEAEWEYAAKKTNHSGMSQIGSGEEWAFNNWSNSHMGGTDPLGGASGSDPNSHSQKTRRDAPGHLTARLIRSVDGVGPALRLVISADSDYPPGMNSPCDFEHPKTGDEPTNSYRDPRWITGSDYVWGGGPAPSANLGLTLWEDGTARKAGSYGGRATEGRWFTSNNIALVFVPTSGSPTTYMYIFLDETQGAIISDEGLMVYGRFAKKSQSTVTKPSISAMSGEALAKTLPNFATRYKMIDMVNMPVSARGKDPALLDGANSAWWQDNVGKGYGGTHRYRKDIDEDLFRFVVYEGGGSPVNLAYGDWFTINNMFLRVTDNRSHRDGPYVTDYLYAISGSGNSRILFHNSFQAYERADTRGLDFTASNSSVTGHAREIDRDLSRSMYAPGGYMGNIGQSTFTPAPCPAGGCN